MGPGVVVRIGAVLLVGLVYVLGSYWLMTHTRSSPWNVVGVFAPMMLIAGIATWRSGHRGIAICIALAFAALCVQALMGIQVTAHVLYLLQHAGINFAVGLFFGSTLRPGRKALITAVAEKVHGGALGPKHLAYTRQVTAAWTIYFAVIVSVSLLLFFFASFDTWAVFANLVTPVATVAMFAGEFSIRYRLHPDFKRSTIAEAIQAYMQTGKPDASKVTPQPQVPPAQQVRQP